MNTITSFFENPTVKTVFYVIGILWVSGKLLKILKAFYNVAIRPRKNFVRRYGANSYVMVTGASDGIGKEFCKQFAKLGFNIVLLARNRKKLEDTSDELKKLNPKINVQIVQADLAQSQNEEFFDNIYNQVKDLDISVLINNAGIDCYDKFLDLKDSYLKDLINVNCLPPVMLTRKLLPKMSARASKSAVLNVSSGAGIIPLAYYTTYSGTKALVDLFTRSLADEYPNMDIMSLKPFDVSTKMMYYKAPDIMTITIEECVRGTLNDLGHQDDSYGHWKHKLQGELYMFIPRFIFNFIYLKFVAPDFFKEREEGKKKYEPLKEPLKESFKKE